MTYFTPLFVMFFVKGGLAINCIPMAREPQLAKNMSITINDSACFNGIIEQQSWFSKIEFPNSY